VRNARVQIATLLAFVAVAFAIPTGVASAGDSVGETYDRYAQVRQQLLACSLDETWNHMSATGKKRCVRLRRLYTLWSDPNYSGTSYHVHCRVRSRCFDAPPGEPDPRRAIPRGSTVIR
jgi:hypothetical protein